jgi:uncharacterized protein
MKKLPLAYRCFFIIIMSSWLYYMVFTSSFGLYKTSWVAPLTMIFGSFIAGASSEGGGAVAYPVFTLLLKIPANTAMNFSFACQSVGMTAASLLIIGLKIKVSWKAVVYSSFGGIFGLLLSAFYIAPYLPSAETKLFFVSLWLSFGFALYLANRKKTRKILDEITLKTNSDKLKLVFVGFVGGIITAFFGNGIDLLTFCFLTLSYQLSEKVATPTSVVIMTINTLVGFFLHAFIIKDFNGQAFDFWLCSIPVVIIFAPLGAYLINFFSRNVIVAILYGIIVVQYLGALYIIQPSLGDLLLSVSVIFLGFMLFYFISTNKKIIAKK